MECSSVSVSRRAFPAFRVFLLDSGVWLPVSQPYTTEDEAARFGKPLVEAHPTVLYKVRPCMAWRN